ncbi:DUF3656 domain-containing U32 family peptidase [Calderihabitans maritimus]|uniref:DUF3656 domain-containing U32 family peptidase n=1 Tax=Calderihabitans maritimus TaxID=1246530 RepID=UPI00192CF59A|nr:DUF3656 domain-containing protein [Calderihabitans maritimus]
MQKPELLAPAGNMEALMAAVENGADAVYLGGKLFSARHYADNFDDQEMKEALAYSQPRGVKIYVTVNTLLDKRELESAVRFIYRLTQQGINAVIVQDLGLLKILREVLPQLEIHASTQMTVHNSAGCRFLEKHGVKRVVLAREVSLNNIKNIRQKTDIELETFVHGALCISYSGQCLMSSMIGGRSGNRGRCAQPCRMTYRLVDEKGRELTDKTFGLHLLSPRDLNMLDCLPQLVEAGVRAFKVEGRMKRPEYVATVTRIYRQVLDRYWENPEHFFVTEREQKELEQIFNRQFTTGYFFGNPGRDLMSYKRPNNRGLFLGRVTGYNAGTKQAIIRLEEPLRRGDGIEVWVSRGSRVGTTVEEIWWKGQKTEEAPAGAEVVLPLTRKVEKGDRVFKTYDRELMARAHKSYSGPGSRKIKVNAMVRAKEGEPLRIELTDPAGRKASAETQFLGEKALKHPLTEEVIRRQLERLGNTPFELGHLEAEIIGNIMVPLSEINKARREAVARLEELRAEEVRLPTVPRAEFEERLQKVLVEVSDQKRPRTKPLLSVVVGDIASLEAALDSGADRIYFGGEQFRSKPPITNRELEEAVEKCRALGKEAVLVMPRIWHEDQVASMVSDLRQVATWHPDGIMVGNLGSLQLVRETCPQIRIFGDYPLNVFNDHAALFMAEEGIYSITLSPELNFEQLKELSLPVDISLECLVHGFIPLMISEYCAVGAILGERTEGTPCRQVCYQGRFGLKDRMNFIFPLESDQYCRMFVFNPKELCLIEDLPLFMDLGINSLRIEAKKESAEYVRRVVTAYRTAIDEAWQLRKDKGTLTKLKEELEKASAAGFTKGHYYRGVL